MASKCVYCSKPLSIDEVVDVCDKCGVGVWGQKMFAAIKENCETAKKDGSFYQGSVT